MGKLSRYRVKGPAALPDAVCVEHVENAAEDPGVCSKKEWCRQGMDETSEGTAQQHQGARPISHPGTCPPQVKWKRHQRSPVCLPAPPRLRAALTQLPAAHVIELSAEEQGGDDVDDREDNPEGRVPFAKHLGASPHE